MKNKKGFTLVELVIVIAVIAILAAVLIPTFAGIIERAKENSRIQKATTARDEYYSSSENVVTPEDMVGYIISVDEHYYEIETNGKLNSVNIDIANSENDTIYVELNDVNLNGAKIYKSTTAGGYVNGQFLVWSDLIDNNYISVQDMDLRQTAADLFGDSVPEITEELNTAGIQENTTQKCIVGMSTEITRLIFGGNQAEVVINFAVYDLIQDFLFYTWDVSLDENNQDTYDFSSVENVNLEEVIMLDGVEYIAPLAFANCTALKSVTIPDSMIVIGMSAFTLCTSLEDVKINTTSHLELLDNAAFLGCSSLKNIYLPEGLTEMRAYTFVNSGLTSVIIPSRVEIIVYTCFRGCADLKTMVLPASCVEILKKACKESGLETIYYTGTSAQYDEIIIENEENDIIFNAQVYYSGEWSYVNGVPKAN